MLQFALEMNSVDVVDQDEVGCETEIQAVDDDRLSASTARHHEVDEASERQQQSYSGEADVDADRAETFLMQSHKTRHIDH